MKRLRRTVTGFGILLTILLIIGGIYFFSFERSNGDIESALESYAKRYAGSVAFVMVQYHLRVDDMVVYSQIREGTAFLVDEAGYLLTNRHVACPWLKDDTLFNIIEQIRAGANGGRAGDVLVRLVEREQSPNNAGELVPGVRGIEAEHFQPADGDRCR